MQQASGHRRSCFLQCTDSPALGQQVSLITFLLELLRGIIHKRTDETFSIIPIGRISNPQFFHDIHLEYFPIMQSGVGSLYARIQYFPILRLEDLPKLRLTVIDGI